MGYKVNYPQFHVVDYLTSDFEGDDYDIPMTEGQECAFNNICRQFDRQSSVIWKDEVGCMEPNKRIDYAKLASVITGGIKR